MSLSKQLEEYTAAAQERMPEDIKKTFAAAIAELIDSGIDKQALNVGDIAPDFALPNTRGETRSLSAMLEDGPVVVSFYRGEWCPYCNFELRALQEKLPEIEDLGARLVAVSPELPDHTMSAANKNAITFDILSDLGNEAARAFGIVFELPLVLRPLYKNFGIDLPANNGDESFSLPIPATYVIGAGRKIIAAYVNMDYATRMEPQKIIDALRQP